MIRRVLSLPLGAVLGLAAGVFGLVVPPALLVLSPGVETLGGAVLATLPALVVALAVAILLWIEARLGRRIMPALAAYPFPRTPAQVRVERRAGAALGAAFVFFSGAPVLATILSKGAVEAHALSPLLVWAFLLRLFGWRRMRAGVLHMIHRAEPPSREDEIDIMTGFALLAGGTGPWSWSLYVEHDAEAPILSARLVRDREEDGAVRRVNIEGRDALALMLHLTGDGDPHALRFFSASAPPRPGAIAREIRGRLDLDALSSHRRMALAGIAAAARKRADALLAG